MIDIHSHILCGVDDGAPTMEESFKMLAKAAELGITTIFATPHFHENLFALKGISKNYEEISEKAKEFGITLRLGSEVAINPFVAELVESESVLLLNGSRYILLELPYDNIPMYTYEIIYKLQLQRITPIIAHPERNMNTLKSFEAFVNIMEKGCLIQLDAGSITGAYGSNVESYAKKLVKLNMAHFVASDAHCANDYGNWFLQSFKKVRSWAGEDYARKLFIHNPQRVLDNVQESIYEMI